MQWTTSRSATLEVQLQEDGWTFGSQHVLAVLQFSRTEGEMRFTVLFRAAGLNHAHLSFLPLTRKPKHFRLCTGLDGYRALLNCGLARLNATTVILGRRTPVVGFRTNFEAFWKRWAPLHGHSAVLICPPLLRFNLGDSAVFLHCVCGLTDQWLLDGFRQSRMFAAFLLA